MAKKPIPELLVQAKVPLVTTEDKMLDAGVQNLGIWRHVYRTDPSMAKHVRTRGGFTSIDAQHQKKMATYVFGPAGIGWGIVDEKFDYHGEGFQMLCSYTAKLFYHVPDMPEVFGPLAGKRGEIPIGTDCWLFTFDRSSGNYDQVKNHMKSLRTDALTKGLSDLGFNSDVFEGMFDGNPYVQAMDEHFRTFYTAIPGKNMSKSKKQPERTLKQPQPPQQPTQKKKTPPPSTPTTEEPPKEAKAFVMDEDGKKAVLHYLRQGKSATFIISKIKGKFTMTEAVETEVKTAADEYKANQDESTKTA